MCAGGWSEGTREASKNCALEAGFHPGVVGRGVRGKREKMSPQIADFAGEGTGHRGSTRSTKSLISPGRTAGAGDQREALGEG